MLKIKKLTTLNTEKDAEQQELTLSISNGKGKWPQPLQETVWFLKKLKTVSPHDPASVLPGICPNS